MKFNNIFKIMEMKGVLEGLNINGNLNCFLLNVVLIYSYIITLIHEWLICFGDKLVHLYDL